MRDADAEPKRRDAGDAAAPFLHPKVSPVEAAKPEQLSRAEREGIQVQPRPRDEDGNLIE